MRGWSLYQIPAVESWDGALKVEAYLRALAASGRATMEVEGLADRFHSAARTLAQFTSWDGDGDWMVAGLPDAETASVLLVFMVNQRRDHLTFVASELPLPWLEKHRCPAVQRLRESTKDRDAAVAGHVERARAVATEIVEERLKVS